MLASAACFAVSTSLVKFMGPDFPAVLQTFYRQVAGIIALLPFMVRSRGAVFKTTRLRILLFRAAAGSAGMILAFYSYQEMPMADANALSFTRTLWLVPLAAFVLGERVGVLRVSATAVGFVGVLFMVQPAAAASFGWPAAAALGSAFLFALTVTGMKIMTRDHSAMTITVYSAVLGLFFVLPFAIGVWRWPDATELLLLAIMGVSALGAQYFFITAMTVGDAAAMAPLDYTRLIFSVTIGYLFFQETPNSTAMIGALIIIAATLFITLREAQAQKGLTRPPAQPE
ncbi:MAG: DMT family transporter [Hyphomonadaceae bacterium]